MIDDGAAVVARAAAGKLVPRYGARLVADVEARIYSGGGAQQAEEQTTPDQYVDPVALGALIVAVAQLGYQVYGDHKKKGQRPTREVIARAIRIERRKHSDLTGEEAEVIDIVSAKIIENGDGELPGDAGHSGSALVSGASAPRTSVPIRREQRKPKTPSPSSQASSPAPRDHDRLTIEVAIASVTVKRSTSHAIRGLPEDSYSGTGQLLSSIRGVGGSGLVSGSLGNSPGPLLLPGDANPVGPRWRSGVLRPATRPSAADGWTDPGRAGRR